MKNFVAHTLVAVAVMSGFTAPTMETAVASENTVAVTVPSTSTVIGVLGN